MLNNSDKKKLLDELPFFDPSETMDSIEARVAEKKQQLLEMAREGKPKPNREKDSLGLVLRSYTNKSSKCYDLDFDKKIRKLRPDWFLNPHVDKKAKLIKMAKNGEPRAPQYNNGTQQRKIYRWGLYVRRGHRLYDPDFDKQIRRLRPDWFRPGWFRLRPANRKKEQLLVMARAGEPRPNRKKKDKLGRELYRYSTKCDKCYDPDFDERIRNLRPDWFRKGLRPDWFPRKAA